MNSELIVTMGVAAVFGALAGSFLNVCIWRLPRNLSIVNPPSRCGCCGTLLAWHENLPIIGYVRLAGRCAHCGVRLSPRYLFLELISAALAAGVVAWAYLSAHAPAPAIVLTLTTNGYSAEVAELAAKTIAAVVVLVVAQLSLVAWFIDREFHIIPDELTVPLLLLAPLIGVGTGAVVNDSSWIPLTGYGYVLGEYGSMFQGSHSIWLMGGALAALLLTIPFARLVYGNLPGPERWRPEDLNILTRTTLACAGVLLPVAFLVPWALSHGNLGISWGLTLGQVVLGAVAGWLAPTLVGLLGAAALRRNAMGFGDAKLFAPLGAMLGPLGVVEAFLTAVAVAAALGIPGWLRGGASAMAFGPALIVGWGAVMVLGPGNLVAWLGL